MSTLPYGVSMSGKRFRARCMVNGRQVDVGCYTTAEEASEAVRLGVDIRAYSAPRNAPSWSMAEKAALMALWVEGHSTSEIGRRLKRTKNAVIGEAHRIGCPSRQSPIRAINPDEIAAKRVRARKVPVRVHRAILSVSERVALLASLTVALPSPRPVRVEPRRPIPEAPAPITDPETGTVFRAVRRECQWPVERVGRTWRMCEAVFFGRGSYCAVHGAQARGVRVAA